MKYIGTIGKMYDNHPPRYFNKSYDDLIDFSNRYICKSDESIKKLDASVSWHESARNELVQNAEGKWLLMLDTDHQFAPDMLDRLLFFKNKYNCRVINGIYQYKFPPHNPVMNLWGGNNEVIPILDWDREADILEIGSCGAGCLLVDLDVYQEVINKFNTMPFTTIQGLSEDYSFFLRCKELGITCYMAPKVQCHHVITTPLSIEDYQPKLNMNVKGKNGIIC